MGSESPRAFLAGCAGVLLAGPNEAVPSFNHSSIRVPLVSSSVFWMVFGNSTFFSVSLFPFSFYGAKHT